MALIGAQRRRQDHHAARHLGPAAAPRAGASSSTAQRLDGLALARRSWPAASPTCRRAPALPDDDGAGEPRAGRAHAGGRAGGGPRRSSGSSTSSRGSRERRGQLAGTLSGGEQQMCAIGRGLMARPRLLMLDEPSLGLAPVMVKAIFEDLARINARGLTILLVEQNVLRSLQLGPPGLRARERPHRPGRGRARTCSPAATSSRRTWGSESENPYNSLRCGPRIGCASVPPDLPRPVPVARDPARDPGRARVHRGPPPARPDPRRRGRPGPWTR